ncbi:hypothetical protein N7461_000237 [Penicillium sp. DV-2018c]|nr:hypothetical protein N7461_000237 [Penicillium sp. DV-2018c]
MSRGYDSLGEYQINLPPRIHRDELLTRPEAGTIVAEFKVKTARLGQFQADDYTALGEEEGGDEGKKN